MAIRSCEEHRDVVVVYEDWNGSSVHRQRGCPLCDADVNFESLERTHESVVGELDDVRGDLGRALETITSLERDVDALEQERDAAIDAAKGEL